MMFIDKRCDIATFPFPWSLCGCVIFSQLKGVFQKNGQPLKVYERLAAGSSAGVVAQTAIYPMEVSLQHKKNTLALLNLIAKQYSFFVVINHDNSKMP